MIHYFSGTGCKHSNPEIALGEEANVMLTFYSSFGKAAPEERFRKIYKARRIQLKNKKERRKNK
jgi:hypothetical protein